MNRFRTTLFFLIITTAAFSQTSLPYQSVSTYPALFSFSLFNVQRGQQDNDILPNSKSFYVYIFLSPECPLCQHYIPELKRLQEKYKENIVINGIVPGRAYDANVLTKFIDEYKINFPVYIDSSKKLTNYLKAGVTPEVMLFSNTTEKLYGGAVDDWMKELGIKKIKATQFYLEDAIEQSMQGKSVTIKKTEAKGCLINDL